MQNKNQHIITDISFLHVFIHLILLVTQQLGNNLLGAVILISQMRIRNVE